MVETLRTLLLDELDDFFGRSRSTKVLKAVKNVLKTSNDQRKDPRDKVTAVWVTTQIGGVERGRFGSIYRG